MRQHRKARSSPCPSDETPSPIPRKAKTRMGQEDDRPQKEDHDPLSNVSRGHPCRTASETTTYRADGSESLPKEGHHSVTGEPDALKGASPVRRGTVGKGLAEILSEVPSDKSKDLRVPRWPSTLPLIDDDSECILVTGWLGFTCQLF